MLQESSRLYLARHPGGGDPQKRVALHKRLAGAYLHRGQMEESTRNFDEALTLPRRGRVRPRVPASCLALAKTLIPVVPRPLSPRRRRGAPSGGDRARPRDHRRSCSTAPAPKRPADPARFLLQGIATLRQAPARRPRDRARRRHDVRAATRRTLRVRRPLVRRGAPLPRGREPLRRSREPDRGLPRPDDELHVPLPAPATGTTVTRSRSTSSTTPSARGQLWDVAPPRRPRGASSTPRRDAGARPTRRSTGWRDSRRPTRTISRAVYVHACPAYLYAERRQLDAALAASDGVPRRATTRCC